MFPVPLPTERSPATGGRQSQQHNQTHRQDATTLGNFTRHLCDTGALLQFGLCAAASIVGAVARRLGRWDPRSADAGDAEKTYVQERLHRSIGGGLLAGLALVGVFPGGAAVVRFGSRETRRPRSPPFKATKLIGKSVSGIRATMSSKATLAKSAVASPSARTDRRSCSARHSVDLPEELGPLTRIATGADSGLTGCTR